MRILAITAFYPPNHTGGYELRCRDVIEGLRHKGHDICLVTNQVMNINARQLNDEQWVHRILCLKSEGMNVFSIIRADIKELQKIEKIIENYKPDLLYLWHMQNFSDAILPYLGKHKLPIVYDEGGSSLIFYTRLQKRGLYFYKNEQDSVLKRWLKQGIKAYAGMVSGGRIVPDWEWPVKMGVYFNSYSALEHAREMGVPVEDADVIPSGIDISKFPFQPRDKISSPVRIVIPARIKQQKGCKDGILLVDELRKRTIPAQVLIIGEVQSKNYYNELLRIARDLGLSELVELRAMVSQGELSEIYRNTDICFFTSYFKTGFSRVPLEAMASGCLVITYGNEGTAELVRHGETGFITNDGNIKGASDWIEKMIKELITYQKMAQAARNNIELNFNMEHYVDSIESFLQNCRTI